MIQGPPPPTLIEQLLDYWPVAAGLIGWLVTHLVHNGIMAFQIKRAQKDIEKLEDRIDKIRDGE